MILRRIVMVSGALVMVGGTSAWTGRTVAAVSSVAQTVTRACTVDQIARWKQVATDQLGVAAGDAAADRRWIGPVSNAKKASSLPVKSVGGRNWFPVDGFKRTACGGFKKFSVYDPKWSGAETDFHVHFEPSERFNFILNNLHDLTPHREIYGEITLPTALRIQGKSVYRPKAKNPFGDTDVETALELGSDVCVYGPWVTEAFHANQPEIHPAELFWFRLRTPAEKSEKLRIFAAHDASDRFQKERYYCAIERESSDCETRLPKGFIPWSGSSSRYQFLFPYSLALDQVEKRRMTIASWDTHGAALTGGKDDAVIVQHDRGESTLTFTRFEGSDRLAVSDLNQLRCSTTLNDRPVALGFIGATLVVDDSRPGAADGMARIEVSGQLVDHEYTPRGVEEPAAVPVIDAETIRLDGGRLVATVSEIGDSIDIFARDVRGGPLLGLDGRFKAVDHERPSQRYFEVDLETSYVGEGANEAAADYLNVFRRGDPFDREQRPTPAVAAIRFRDFFGKREGFDAAVQAQFEQQPRAEVGRCPSHPSAADTGVLVCIAARTGGVQPDGEVADVRIYYGRSAQGRVMLLARVTDLFGNVKDVSPVVVTVPRTTSSLDEDGLLGRDVRDIIAGARLSPEKGDRLQALLKEMSAPPSQTAQGARLPYLAECDEASRFGRLFWISAKWFSHDSDLDNQERRALSQLLTSFDRGKPDCAER